MKAQFDIEALEYDSNFTNSNIGKAQRLLVYLYLDPLVKVDETLNILEVNCGTGEDAVYFGSLGHRVIATDISEKMIEVAKLKAHTDSVKFQPLDIRHLNDTYFTERFDLIVSNFGGLNCLSKTELSQFINTANDLLRPNGKLVMVIMPKHCLWEQLYFLLKGDLKKNRRRQTADSVEANLNGISVRTWYYNPSELLKMSKKAFKHKTIKPIGLTIPPSYLEGSFVTQKLFLTLFKKLDRLLNWRFFAKYADHFYIELQKR